MKLSNGVLFFIARCVWRCGTFRVYLWFWSYSRFSIDTLKAVNEYNSPMCISFLC